MREGRERVEMDRVKKRERDEREREGEQRERERANRERMKREWEKREREILLSSSFICIISYFLIYKGEPGTRPYEQRIGTTLRLRIINVLCSKTFSQCLKLQLVTNLTETMFFPSHNYLL